jgi:mono/diheme cytochrome c family protein
VKPLLIVSLLFFFLSVGQTQETQPAPKNRPPAEYKIPPEAARQVNPIKPTPESLEKAKKLYGYDCAMCHGKDGDGKGDVGADMKLKVSDFSDPATLKDITDGELFYIIKNGAREMPPEGGRVKADEIWNLIHYIRGFAKKKSAEAAKPPAQ